MEHISNTCAIPLINSSQMPPFDGHCLEQEITRARLGYASVNIGTVDDLGCGPILHQLSYHVDEDKLQAIRDLAIAGTLDQTSTDPARHLSLLIKRSALEVQLLEQDVNSKPYSSI